MAIAAIDARRSRNRRNNTNNTGGKPGGNSNNRDSNSGNGNNNFDRRIRSEDPARYPDMETTTGKIAATLLSADMGTTRAVPQIIMAMLTVKAMPMMVSSISLMQLPSACHVMNPIMVWMSIR